MASNAEVATFADSTDAVKAAMLANNNAAAGLIAPLTTSPSNFTSPDQYGKALAAFPLYDNSSRTASLLATDPGLFPPGVFPPNQPRIS